MQNGEEAENQSSELVNQLSTVLWRDLVTVVSSDCQTSLVGCQTQNPRAGVLLLYFQALDLCYVKKKKNETEQQHTHSHIHTHTREILLQRKYRPENIPLSPSPQKETIRKLLRLDLASGWEVGEPPLRMCKQRPDPLFGQLTHDL